MRRLIPYIYIRFNPELRQKFIVLLSCFRAQKTAITIANHPTSQTLRTAVHWARYIWTGGGVPVPVNPRGEAHI